MHPDPVELFEHRIAGLERFVAQATTFDVYDAGASLRQLLLDSPPLVDIVNRPHKLPLKFRVNRVPPDAIARLGDVNAVVFPGPAVASSERTLGSQVEILSRKRFLSTPVPFTSHHAVTVREFILFAAHKAGGVHFDATPDQTTELLNRFMRAFDSHKMPLFASTKIGIAEVVVAAVSPLRAKLKTEGPHVRGT